MIVKVPLNKYQSILAYLDSLESNNRTSHYVIIPVSSFDHFYIHFLCDSCFAEFTHWFATLTGTIIKPESQ